MRFYNESHQHYCGIDLHAKTMYLCILDREGQILLHKNMRSSPETFLDAVAPYRDDLVVAVECMFTWYWLADLCRREGHRVRARSRPLHEGHPRREGQERQGRRLQDRQPAARREPSEGLRVSRPRCEPPGICFADVSTWSAAEGTCWPTSRTPTTSTTCRSPARRSPTRPTAKALPTAFAEPDARKSMEVDFLLIEHYDEVIRELELHLVRRAKRHDPQTPSTGSARVPGIGKILALTILYEIHDIARFERVQDFLSYARLVKCEHSSAGKKLGSGGAKIGNVHLKWAFSEAAVFFLRNNPEGQKHLAATLRAATARPRRSRSWPAKLGREPSTLMLTQGTRVRDASASWQQTH